ncbi:MAG: response regulator [Pseudomonadota bacterium]
MPERLDGLLLRQKPTAERPLAGQTVLVIEDSRFASEAMRLMCLRSGARVRRADSLASAARHLATYRPSVAVVDLGLPDGSGTSLISELTSISPPVEVIIAVSGDPSLGDRAVDAGAHAFVEKPMTSLAAFQELILGYLPDEDRPPGARTLNEDDVAPDRIALRDDLVHLKTVLSSQDADERLAYAAQFLASIARAAGDAGLEEAANLLADATAPGRDFRAVIAKVLAILEPRIADTAIV